MLGVSESDITIKGMLFKDPINCTVFSLSAVKSLDWPHNQLRRREMTSHLSKNNVNPLDGALKEAVIDGSGRRNCEDDVTQN